MKILLVSSYLPYPLDSGGHIRLYNLLKRLCKNHEITLVCEKRDYQNKTDEDVVKKICNKLIVVSRKKQWSFRNVLKSGFSYYPFLMVGHANKQLQDAISKELNSNFYNVIHVETFYVMQNLPAGRQGLPNKLTVPVVLVEHNVEYLVYARYAKTAPFFIRPLLQLDVAKIKYWEKYFWKKADKLIAVSENEKKIMGLDAAIVANGVDVRKYQVSSIKYKVSKPEKRVLFIGNFKWIQNRDSLEWILKEIWSVIKLKVQSEKLKISPTLWIVGKEIPSSIKSTTNDRSVIFDENAPKETEKIYELSDILLAPIRVGGGTSYKILEAMASGVPVVTTKLGIEGIEAVDNKEVLIADAPEDIASKTVELLNNKNLYEKIARGGRNLIEEKYDWDILVKKLEEVYKKVAG